MGLMDIVGDIFGSPNPQVNVPGPTADQQALQKMQLDALTKQGKITDMLLPYQLKNMGLNAVMGSDGGIQSISEDPAHAQSQQLQNEFMKMSMSQLQAQEANQPGANEITKLQQDRTLSALKGTLPVNSALTRELGDQETVLRDTLRRQLGTGFETSDPGIRSLATFNQRKNETMDAARRGDLSLSDQLSQARSAGTFGQGMSSGQLAEQLRGMNLGQLMGGGSSLSGFINNTNAPQQLGFQNQQLGFMGNNATAGFANDIYKTNMNWFNNEQDRAANIFGTIFGGKSDRRLKENIYEVGKLPSGLSIYAYNLIGEKLPRLGVMADEAIHVFPEAVGIADDGFYRVDYSKIK